MEQAVCLFLVFSRDEMLRLLASNRCVPEDRIDAVITLSEDGARGTFTSFGGSSDGEIPKVGDSAPCIELEEARLEYVNIYRKSE